MPDILTFTAKNDSEIPGIIERLRAKCEADGIGVHVRSFPFALPADIGIFGITAKTTKMIEVSSASKGSGVNFGPGDECTLLLIPPKEEGQ